MLRSSSARKRLIDNPFIKPANQTWSITSPAILTRPISPPPSISKSPHTSCLALSKPSNHEESPTAAEREAGEASITDYLSFWTAKLLAVTQPPQLSTPRLTLPYFSFLYSTHASFLSGSHFVIHQHDHPIAGLHYDLRLQCNLTSSLSFAIMYGLPGDPNSLRLNRNATETRVHCLWNHLIESASLESGSMLIWDTGFYEVLPYKEKFLQTADSDSDFDSYESAPENPPTEQQQLHCAFSQRRIRLRLHGTRLPPGYTITLRLTKENNRFEQPGPPSRKRKRKPKATRKLARRAADSASDSDAGTDASVDIGPFRGERLKRSLSSLVRHETPPPPRRGQTTAEEADPGGSDGEVDEQEDIRRNNAYPRAVNDVGSVNQRRWFLSLDRVGSGFEKDATRNWIRKVEGNGVARGFERFHVLGRDVERSVVTGRLAEEVWRDEGVVSLVPRGGWRGVVE